MIINQHGTLEIYEKPEKELKPFIKEILEMDIGACLILNVPNFASWKVYFYKERSKTPEKSFKFKKHEDGKRYYACRLKDKEVKHV